ncbi:hypothetical protein AB0K92_15815 [Streptomyces sp. NPDC052687]
MAEDDWGADTRRGRRFCPQHPTQQMIPIGMTDVCPLEGVEAPPKRTDG